MRGLLSRLVQWMIRRWDLDDGLVKIEVQHTYGIYEKDTLAVWTHEDETFYIKVRFVCQPGHIIARRWPKKVNTRNGVQVMPKAY